MTPARDRGLGRGIEALIPSTGHGTPPVAGVEEVPLDRVRPNPKQPRASFDNGALAELADSIQQHGILQPVIVTRVADGYQLIAGERRWRAARLAGLATVPVVVKEGAAANVLELALVENLQREDLTPIEEALAYRQLIDEHGFTQEVVARRIGKSRVAVTNRIRLLQLPDETRKALENGAISEGHARALLGAATPADGVALLGRVLAGGLSVRETERLVRQPARSIPEAAGTHGHLPDPDLARLEDAFRQALGTRVQLVRSGGGGRLVIHFYSDDELQGLYEAIVGDEG